MFSRAFYVGLITCLSGWAVAAPVGDLALQGVDLTSGKTMNVSLKTAKKATVLTFLSAKCPCSESHEATIEALAAEYGKDGFQFVAVHSNANEDVAIAKTHFQKLKVPVLRDEGSKLAIKLGAMKTPHAFVLSPAGEVLYQGGVDDSSRADMAKEQYLKLALQAIKKGEAPSPKESRALGCYIMRPEDL